MTSETDVLLRKLAGKSKIKIVSGTFVSYTATQYMVDCGNGRIPVTPLVGYLPTVNETIWIAFIDGVPYALGPTVVHPGQGTVVSTSGGLATLTTDVGTVVVPYDTRLTLTAGQVVQLVWQKGGFGVAVMSVVPAGGTAPGAPVVGAPVAHSQMFTALDAGSFQSGRWWTPEVWVSTNNVGAWFYGTKIADTIPASATNVSIQIYISPKQIQFAAPNFGLHAYASKPAGAPTFTSLTGVAVAAGWVTLPASFVAALKSGGGSFGIGASNTSSYDIFRSLAEDGQSGALLINSTY